MTSSLVGSEMCIRDSSLASLGDAGMMIDASSTIHNRVRRVQHQQHHLPVSYTHLTLPTICSV
eukprot:10587213-Prorocentrum_lima.AAC.1